MIFYKPEGVYFAIINGGDQHSLGSTQIFLKGSDFLKLNLFQALQRQHKSPLWGKQK